MMSEKFCETCKMPLHLMPTIKRLIEALMKCHVASLQHRLEAQAVLQVVEEEEGGKEVAADIQLAVDQLAVRRIADLEHKLDRALSVVDSVYRAWSAERAAINILDSYLEDLRGQSRWDYIHKGRK